MSTLKIVCIGDSLTEAYGIPATLGWAYLLSKELPVQVINSGISGDTTAGMLARFQFMVIAHKPNCVIITGGTNDLSLDVPDSLILSNILSMARLAKHYQISVIIGIPPPSFCEENLPNQSVYLSPVNLIKRLEKFRKHLRKFALEENLPLIDFSLNMTPKHFLEDGLHPNKTGHKIMKDTAKIVVRNVVL